MSHYYLKVLDRISLVATDDATYKDTLPAFHYLEIEKEFTYVGFCDDFGPMSLSTVYKFCRKVTSLLKIIDDRSLILITSNAHKSYTNAIFLVGAYMIMCLDQSAQSVREELDHLVASTKAYCDVSPGDIFNFALRVEDC